MWSDLDCKFEHNAVVYVINYLTQKKIYVNSETRIIIQFSQTNEDIRIRIEICIHCDGDICLYTNALYLFIYG